MDPSADPPALRTGTPHGRTVIAAVAVGSGMAFLDSTVVNVALPALGEDLDVGFSALQWVLDGYLLTLSALLLLGGALGDRFGRRRVYLIGLVVFTAASAACAAAPSAAALTAFRLLQGVGGALLVPGSLAIVGAVFAPQDRSEAIGAWAGWSGVTMAIGPFLGGWLVDVGSWRLVFVINVPLALVTWWLSRSIPETQDVESTRLDTAGGTAATLGLGGFVYALIEGPVRGWTDAAVVAAVVLGAAALVTFVVVERRRHQPMLPLELFRLRCFTGANLVTLVVYAGLSTTLFLVVLELQRALGYSALEAGAAMVPINALLLVASPAAGRYAQTHGYRTPMTVGPVIGGIGLLVLTQVTPGATFLTGVLPGILVLGVGLAITVAPLTSAVLAAVPDRRTGVASGVNNAVARSAGLLAVAVIPLVAGISGATQLSGSQLASGYQRAMVVSAGLLWAGAIVAALTIPGEPDELRARAEAAQVA